MAGVTKAVRHRSAINRSHWHVIRILLMAVALLSLVARSGEAATARMPPRAVVIPVEDLAIPVTISGDVAYETHNGVASVDARLTTDLANLQKRSTEVLRAALDRDPNCGDRIKVLNGHLSARKPALKVTATLDYEKTACLGAAKWTLVPRSQVFVDMALHPLVQARSLRFRAEVLDVRSPTLPAEGNAKEVLKKALGLVVSEQIGELFPKDGLAHDAVLRDLSFEETKAGRLVARAAGSTRMPAAKLQGLLKGNPK